MINLQCGFERVSAIWWGLWGLGGVLMFAAAVFGESSDRLQLAMIGGGLGIGAYIAHRITCWIVAGFFAPRS